MQLKTILNRVQIFKKDFVLFSTEDLGLHHLYQGMDFLEAHEETIEEAIYFRISDLFNLYIQRRR